MQGQNKDNTQHIDSITKTIASKKLKEEVEKEMNLPDPTKEKAEAILNGQHDSE